MRRIILFFGLSLRLAPHCIRMVDSRFADGFRRISDADRCCESSRCLIIQLSSWARQNLTLWPNAIASNISFAFRLCNVLFRRIFRLCRVAAFSCKREKKEKTNYNLEQSEWRCIILDNLLWRMILSFLLRCWMLETLVSCSLVKLLQLRWHFPLFLFSASELASSRFLIFLLDFLILLSISDQQLNQLLLQLINLDYDCNLRHFHFEFRIVWHRKKNVICDGNSSFCFACWQRFGSSARHLRNTSWRWDLRCILSWPMSLFLVQRFHLFRDCHPSSVQSSSS